MQYLANKCLTFLESLASRLQLVCFSSHLSCFSSTNRKYVQKQQIGMVTESMPGVHWYFQSQEVIIAELKKRHLRSDKFVNKDQLVDRLLKYDEIKSRPNFVSA